MRTGVTNEIFHSSGIVFELIARLKTNNNESTISLAQCLIIELSKCEAPGAESASIDNKSFRSFSLSIGLNENWSWLFINEDSLAGDKKWLRRK